MSKNTQEPAGAKSGVSVSDMARTVGLSRQRFHQLLKAGVFPEPLRDEATGRPYYDGPGQAQCVEVRRRNCGVNGKVVLFYARRQLGQAPPPARPTKPRPAPPEPHADVLDGVRTLGLAKATVAQVAGDVQELFPAGTAGVAAGEVIRAVFLRLRKDTADKVG